MLFEDLADGGAFVGVVDGGGCLQGLRFGGLLFSGAVCGRGCRGWGG